MADDRMRIVEGDITTLRVHAIVNAANSALRRGGGVDGAIHRAAGPRLQEACREIGGCPTGEARLTPGFDLPAGYVIHAVGPVWSGGDKGEDAQLAGCYRHSLRLAKEQGCRSVAFPAISTGVYGFPADRAARIAVSTVAEVLAGDDDSFDEVIFCCFGADSRQAHERAMAALG